MLQALFNAFTALAIGSDIFTVVCNADGTGTQTALGQTGQLNRALQNHDNDLRVIADGDTSVLNIISRSSSDLVIKDGSENPPSYTALRKQ